MIGQSEQNIETNHKFNCLLQSSSLLQHCYVSPLIQAGAITVSSMHVSLVGIDDLFRGVPLNKDQPIC